MSDILPSLLGNAVGRMLRFVPDSVLNRTLPRKYRYDPDQLNIAIAPRTPIRLFIGPVNSAGQGWQWARAVERNVPGVGAVSMAYLTGKEFGFPVDDAVPAAGYRLSSSWQRRQLEAVRSEFTHVIVESEQRLFGRIFDQTVEQQVRQLTQAGVNVAFVCHGSDIRLPSRHAADDQNSPFTEPEWDDIPVLEQQAWTNRALLDRLGFPVYVSTPGLLRDVPYARWLPVVVEPQRWHTNSLPLERKRCIVAHAPSSAMLKGSNLIDPILQRLHEAGTIEYRRVQNQPADQMPAVYRAADIVLDQVRLGDYGVAACEALASGRVVMGHVSAHVREHVKSVTGLELPIVETTADTLEPSIRMVLADREKHRALAWAGSAFVDTIHDGRFSANVLTEFLTEKRDPLR